MKIVDTWPDDADGDVFRRLAAKGFDFSKSYSVDYHVDFETWPIPQDAQTALTKMVGFCRPQGPNEAGGGSLDFQQYGPVTYESVTSMQRNVSAAMHQYGGRCDAWGVLHS